MYTQVEPGDNNIFVINAGHSGVPDEFLIVFSHSGCAEILNALIEASHWHPWRVLAGYDSPERDDACMPSTET